MAHTYEEQSRTLPADTDLSASQYCFMKMTSGGKAAVASDGGADVIGVLSNKPAAADREARIVTGGTTKVRAAASISAGDLISVDSAGKAVAVGTGDAAVGRAVDAGSNGSLISVMLDFHSTS